MTTWFYTLGGAELLREPAILWTSGSLAFVFILMFISLSKQFMPFVRLAEKTFCILGLPDPANMDLVISSRQQRTEQDGSEFGTFYFRY